MPQPEPRTRPQPTTHDLTVNEVHLVGRVSAEPETRTLPSGDEVVLLRIVVGRRPTRSRAPVKRLADGGAGAGPSTRSGVDTIDVACWGAGVRRTALRLHAGQPIEVLGALRRRFYRAGSTTQSRYEVEATRVRRKPVLLG